MWINTCIHGEHGIWTYHILALQITMSMWKSCFFSFSFCSFIIYSFLFCEIWIQNCRKTMTCRFPLHERLTGWGWKEYCQTSMNSHYPSGWRPLIKQTLEHPSHMRREGRMAPAIWTTPLLFKITTVLSFSWMGSQRLHTWGLTGKYNKISFLHLSSA